MLARLASSSRLLAARASAAPLLGSRFAQPAIASKLLTRPLSLAAGCRLFPSTQLRSVLLQQALPSQQTRSIIIVDVLQPSDRGTPGDPASRQAMLADVARAEEIAMAQFNRLVQSEVERGTITQGRRGLKRFARFQVPTLRRRDERRRARWKVYKAQKQRVMNWIQYRRRRSLA